MTETISTAEQWRAELLHRLSVAHAYYVPDPRQKENAHDLYEKLNVHIHNEAINAAACVVRAMPEIPTDPKAADLQGDLAQAIERIEAMRSEAVSLRCEIFRVAKERDEARAEVSKLQEQLRGVPCAMCDHRIREPHTSCTKCGYGDQPAPEGLAEKAWRERLKDRIREVFPEEGWSTSRRDALQAIATMPPLVADPAPQQGPDLVGWHLYRVEGDAGGMLYVIAPNPEVAVRAWAGRYGWDKSQTNFSVQGLNHQLLIAPNPAQGKEAT